MVCPSIGRNPVQGPCPFLGAVARSEDGKRWECSKASAPPLLGTFGQTGDRPFVTLALARAGLRAGRNPGDFDQG